MYIAIHFLFFPVTHGFELSYLNYDMGGIRTVVARWTTGQQVERSILRHGHDS